MNPLSQKITDESDLVTARLRGRDIAEQIGFGKFDQTLIATAISELARNILSYAQTGYIVIESLYKNLRKGISVQAVDEGPGIKDIESAKTAGYSTAGGLGMGLSGVQRLMDEFSIESAPGKGTKVEVLKWL